jgi:signal transduction histidine kinase
MGAELVIGLLNEDHIVGLVVLGPKRSADPFFPQDLDVLTTVVSQAGVAIQNAQLHSQKELAEAERQQAARLASLGALSAGIAHEIKNPLVAIRAFVELLPDRFEDEEFRVRFGGIVRSEIDRIDALVARLRDLSRPPTQVLSPIDIRQPLDEIISLVKPQLEKAGVNLIRKFDSGLPSIVGDAAHLKQLFLNLVLNALEAMPDGGTLTFSLFTQQTFDHRTLVAEVRDTGSGIPADVLPTIFEPFVTTKHGGSGLGLSICRGITDLHRARIRAADGSPGTIITIEFPTVTTGIGFGSRAYDAHRRPTIVVDHPDGEDSTGRRM